MGFVKVIKNKAYFKRYQTKFRRRREGKTDYFARRNMIKQDKNKYNSQKYRLVVRTTNQYIIAQVMFATLIGDKCMAMASSKELPKYGIKAGLANFSASYATGLLVARRLLNKLGMADAFEGVEEADGEEFHVEEEDLEDGEARPFKAILDIGLKRATVGAKIFAAMKGAADGGLHIPHNLKRLPGYQAPEEKGGPANFEADALRDRIFGGHVAEYMEQMQEEDPQKYESHFAEYVKNGIDSENLEEMYQNGHKAIRENPAHEKAPKKDIKIQVRGNKVFDGKTTYVRKVKKTKEERKGRVANKIAAAQRRLLASLED